MVKKGLRGKGLVERGGAAALDAAEVGGGEEGEVEREREHPAVMRAVRALRVSWASSCARQSS